MNYLELYKLVCFLETFSIYLKPFLFKRAVRVYIV
jgi:hypothetical protein